MGWGTHICHFYQKKDDLTDVLIPYFKSGLDNNEYCVWVTSELSKEEAQFDIAADRLRNPLAVIMSALELKDTYGEHKLLGIIQEQTERIKKELDELRKEESATHELLDHSKL